MSEAESLQDRINRVYLNKESMFILAASMTSHAAKVNARRRSVVKDSSRMDNAKHNDSVSNDIKSSKRSGNSSVREPTSRPGSPALIIKTPVKKCAGDSKVNTKLFDQSKKVQSIFQVKESARITNRPPLRSSPLREASKESEVITSEVRVNEAPPAPASVSISGPDSSSQPEEIFSNLIAASSSPCACCCTCKTHTDTYRCQQIEKIEIAKKEKESQVSVSQRDNAFEHEKELFEDYKTEVQTRLESSLKDLREEQAAMKAEKVRMKKAVEEEQAALRDALEKFESDKSAQCFLDEKVAIETALRVQEESARISSLTLDLTRREQALVQREALLDSQRVLFEAHERSIHTASEKSNVTKKEMKSIPDAWFEKGKSSSVLKRRYLSIDAQARLLLYYGDEKKKDLKGMLIMFHRKVQVYFHVKAQVLPCLFLSSRNSSSFESDNTRKDKF